MLPHIYNQAKMCEKDKACPKVESPGGIQIYLGQSCKSGLNTTPAHSMDRCPNRPIFKFDGDTRIFFPL